MPRACNLNFARGAYAAANKRSVLPSDRTLAENVIRSFEQPVEFQAHTGKGPKHRVQMLNKDQSRHAFPGHVSEQKNKFTVSVRRKNQIAIIAAYQACRFVFVMNAPIVEPRVLVRKQSALNFCGQLHIPLERALLAAA